MLSGSSDPIATGRPSSAADALVSCDAAAAAAEVRQSHPQRATSTNGSLRLERTSKTEGAAVSFECDDDPGHH